ncbi:hypothetical protein Tco_1229331 [Tanacetum coccineum]
MENPNSPNEPNYVEDAHDPNEMVDIPDDEELVDYDGDEEERKEDDDMNGEMLMNEDIEGDQNPASHLPSLSDSGPPIAEPLCRSSILYHLNSKSENEEILDVWEINATLKKKLKDKEMQLVIARMDCASAERRLHESIGWNRRFYKEMDQADLKPYGRRWCLETSGGAGGDGAGCTGAGCSMGIDAANGTPWAEVRKWMTEEFCPRSNGGSRSNVNGRAYIRGLSKNIRGDVTSSQPATIDHAVRMAYQLMGQIIQDKTDEV